MISRFLFIFLIFSITFIFPQNVDIKVISSTASQLILEYNPIYLDTSFTNIQNKTYRNVKLHDGISNDNSESWGLPDLQKKYINVGVPSEAGNIIQVLSYEYIDIEGRVIPIPTPTKTDGVNDFQIIEGENYSSQKDDEEIVNFSTFRLFRGLPIQSIVISPIKFYPYENKIRLAKKIVVKITFAPTTTFSQPSQQDFRFNSRLVINYDVAKYWIIRDNNLKKKEIINSVLANGRWFKFEAPEEGIYIIRKNDLTSYGIDPNTVDPRTIKIYNGGGKPIPENLNTPRPNDLLENAIYIFGEENGKFDDSDYILFYGKGTDFWDYDSLYIGFSRIHNPYSKQNYYWITSGGTFGKRIQMLPSLNDPNAIIDTTSKAFVHWEEDKINIGKSGRHFVGDEFSSSFNSRTYITNLEGLIPNSRIDYQGQFINSSLVSNTLTIDESNQGIYSNSIFQMGTYSYGSKLDFKTSYTGNLLDNRSVLKFTFSMNNASSFGYLNYFEILYERDLKVESDFIIFYSPLTNDFFEYHLSNFSNSDIKVFDVTDYSNVKLISSPIANSGGDYYFQSSGISNKASKYLALCTSKYKTPINPVEMPNQNLHGISDGYEYVIITNKLFTEQAERLRNYRENESKVKRKSGIFYVDEIFNEFSYGMIDPMGIRDFLKYAYDNWNTKPLYVLFFGDGNYDYKNIEGKNKNFVIPAQTNEFLDEIYSYPSDDFYLNVDPSDRGIDLTSGRLNVNTLEEAKVVVDKIIQYENNIDKSSWRNLITFVADDGKKTNPLEDDGAIHTAQTEEIATSHTPKSFEQNKIYLAAYPTVITGLGRRKPEVNQAIIDAINNGTVIMNFVGHGAPDLWTHEQVFVQSVTIPQLHNKNYFFLVGATCDFSYWDKIDVNSGAEDLMLLQDAGTIAVFSATRPVSSGANADLNREFYDKLFLTPRDSLSLPPTIGEVYLLTKNEPIGLNSNSYKFNILGDPAIILNLPEYFASVDSLNGNSLENTIQVKALSKVNINGKIKKPVNSFWDDFNGEGIMTVYDSQKDIYLPEIKYSVVGQGGIIYKSKISINNGEFNTEFVVPKDISYENKKGKIVFYFYNDQYDGVGFSDNIIVGGTDSTIVNDNKGPQMEIFFDNTEYKASYLLTPNSNLIVKLNDETGLNTTGLGIGHKMEAILNDDETKPIDLTNYFTGDLNSGGKSGQINYKFNNLESGEYKIQVKAWDVFNNNSNVSEYFKVVNDDKLIIDYVMNYPNPLSSNTTFTFQQNLVVPINVKIRIYTVAGRLIQELEENNLAEKFVKINWDGRDRDGNQIANGVYLYKLIVTTIDGQYKSSTLGKLAVMR